MGSLVASWSFEPLQLAPTLIVALAYAARARTLARASRPVARWRVASFATALILVVAALVSPLDQLAERDLFVFHMVQHVILGDLAPLAFVAGLTGPILRPVLGVPPVSRLRVLAHPLVALPLWALNLYVWHIPGLYEAALGDAAVHAVQHVLFFTTGGLMWAAVLETLPAPEWFGTGAKLGYVLAVRLLGTALANVFLWSGTVLYGTYAEPPERFGISPLRDQGLAGTVMMLEGSIVTIAVLAWLFLRLAGEGELRQELLERGLDPRAVRRAVRYRRGEELSGRG